MSSSLAFRPWPRSATGKPLVVTCLCAALLLSWTGQPQAARAESMAAKLSLKPFVYKATNLPVVDLLRDVAGAQSLPLVLADGITGVVNADFNLAPEAFFNLLSRSFGLIWYFDGVSLYVYPSNQMQSRLFKLKGVRAEAVEARLAAFGLGDKRFPLRYEPGQQLVMAVGPPRHIELVEAVIAALGASDADRGPMVVKGFGLSYASAVNRVSQGVKVRGVAETLREIYATANKRQEPGGGGDRTAQDTLDSLGQMVGSSPQDRARYNQSVRASTAGMFGNAPAAPASTRSATPQAPATSPPGDSLPAPGLFRPEGSAAAIRPGSGAVFIAEESTNTVFVHAPSDEMASIAALIKQLDVASEMIEIEATIIDISSNELQSLGVDWQAQSGSGRIAISPYGSTSGSQAAGFNITTLLASGGRELLARVRALEGQGSARVVSQPKVLGAANRTALLADKQTASVRVAGNQDAQLFTVEAGTTLQVTPRLIMDPQQTRIGMDVFIEDGGFSGQTVDNIPLVKRTTIRTEVLLNEGQSLLVGGIVVDSSGDNRSGVLGLGKLPVIGGLFRARENYANQSRRLFLLTPKRVWQPVTTAADSLLPTTAVLKGSDTPSRR